MRQICRIMEEYELDYKDRRHIRDVIINRYMSARKSKRDRYPFAPPTISEELEKKWGLRVAVSDTLYHSVTILIEINAFPPTGT